MSRVSLHKPHHSRAVWDRPANGTRLIPTPFRLSPQHNPHYKRCPRAERLRPRSDQPLSRPVPVTGYGRSPDKKRLALSKGQCQVRAALTRRTTLALSGDVHEHGVKLLPRAIVPRDSTVVAFGEAIPHSGGRESTPPYLRMAGHFWWSRLLHREISSRLLHVLSEARGCRRAVADVEHPPRRIEHPLWRTTRIRTGVDAFLRNRPGPSIPSHMPPPPSPSSPAHAAESPPQVGAASKDRAHRSAHNPRERDRLLAHASLKSHPFPITCAAIPRIWRKIFPQNNHTGTDSIRNNQKQSKPPHETFRQTMRHEVGQRCIKPPML